jgi:predicted small secreted protein
MRSVVVVCVTMVITACVADTMRGYIGQDIRNVELSYGPSANQIDLGNGTRAFQWSKVSIDTTPATAVTTTEKDKRGRKSTSTQFTPSSTTVTNCLYTFITTWNQQAKGWIVTGIREPSLDCAIGDLS